MNEKIVRRKEVVRIIADILNQYSDIINLAIGPQVDNSNISDMLCEVLLCLKKLKNEQTVSYEFASVTIPIVCFILASEGIKSTGIFQTKKEIERTTENLKANGVHIDHDRLFNDVSVSFRFKNKRFRTGFTNIKYYNEIDDYFGNMGIVILQEPLKNCGYNELFRNKK